MEVTLTWPGFALVAVGAAAAELPAMVYYQRDISVIAPMKLGNYPAGHRQ